MHSVISIAYVHVCSTAKARDVTTMLKDVMELLGDAIIVH